MSFFLFFYNKGIKLMLDCTHKHNQAYKNGQPPLLKVHSVNRHTYISVNNIVFQPNVHVPTSVTYCWYYVIKNWADCPILLFF